MKKRLIAMLLAASMTAAALIGCGQEEAKESSEASQAVSADASTESIQESTPKSEAALEEPEKFRVVIVRSASRDNSFLDDENDIYAQLEKKLNVDIEWEIYTSSEWNEKKALVLMGEDMPDAFWGSNVLKASDVNKNKDLFVELTEYINEDTMPNLTVAMEKNPDLKYAAENVDGEIYSLPQEKPLRPKSMNIPWINTTWLDNLGLDMPTNIDELTEVLIAFKEQDANGNGDPNDELGYAVNQTMANDMRYIMQPFNVSTFASSNYNMHLNGNGTPVFAPTTENFKEAVKWMHEMYAAGVVDPEGFTQNYSTASSKWSSGTVGLIYAYNITEVLDGELAAQYEPVVISDMNGNVYLNSYIESRLSGCEFVVSKTCKNPEKLLQWADEFYTDLGGFSVYLGYSAVEEQADGSFLLKTADSWNAGMRDYGPMYVSEEAQESAVFAEGNPEGFVLASRENIDIYYTTDHDCAMPPLKYTEEEQERLSLLNTDLGTYLSAKYAEWVVNGNVDAEWDAYVNELNSVYGLEEYVQIHQTAYERYLERQEELK